MSHPPAMDPELMGFVQRYQTLRGYLDSEDELVKDLLQRYQTLRVSEDELIKDLLVYSEGVHSSLQSKNSALIKQLQDLQLDFDSTTRQRRELQQRLQLVQAEKAELLGANPYVVVLIDGDGLLFKEKFVRQGLAGGKQAAYGLRNAILAQCGAHAKNIEVIAHIYANLTGLCKAMRRDGSVESEADVKDFTLGFTQAKASFDVVDVGHGKERADNKIKQNARWHLKNPNCKQIILGISHDSGYAPFLDELFQDDAVKVRITVLEGFPTVRELAATNVHVLNLNDELFRAEKLVDKIEQASAPITPVSESKPAIPIFKPAVTLPEPKSPVTNKRPPVIDVKTIVKSDSVSSVNSPGTTTPATSTTSTPVPTPSTTVTSYARAIKTVTPPPPPPPPPPTITVAVQSRAPKQKPAPPPKSAPWNPGKRGLDPPLQVSQTALDNIKKRKDSNKLCNNHYLRGPCSKGDQCHFEHKYKPTKDELVAIAFLTRLNPCSQGQDCDVEDCIYGHHCPSVINGLCTHPFCKFEKQDHPPGTKFKPHKHSDRTQ
ncbi:hypothetical protein QBC38DRAFT_484111 [Podospora fimiseda]|uniref:C3H1-type domain-containing protein n=1 Tax=Podospora fimiseda TaxID=252190 RepID=A0AAN7BKI4_9PEZI|nr:hypothetical protein QBC38DRAFT_484111 [Podospora fimiseda]